VTSREWVGDLQPVDHCIGVRLSPHVPDTQEPSHQHAFSRGSAHRAGHGAVFAAPHRRGLIGSNRMAAGRGASQVFRIAECGAK